MNWLRYFGCVPLLIIAFCLHNSMQVPTSTAFYISQQRNKTTITPTDTTMVELTPNLKPSINELNQQSNQAITLDSNNISNNDKLNMQIIQFRKKNPVTEKNILIMGDMIESKFEIISTTLIDKHANKKLTPQPTTQLSNYKNTATPKYIIDSNMISTEAVQTTVADKNKLKKKKDEEIQNSTQVVATDIKKIKTKTKHEKSHEWVLKKIQKESYGKPNNNVGIKVKKWTPGKDNPEELGTYYQGDILHPETAIQPRQGMEDISYLWPQGIVYYNISQNFTKLEKQRILLAMNEYHKHTCIKFVAYSGRQRDYVSVERKSTGCWSTLGRVGGKQILNLQSPGCLYYIGTILHELMHAIGFFHEQSRIDRDNYVTINRKNIATGQDHNFVKHNSTSFGLGYDYFSVLHYSDSAFSKNSAKTIDPVTPGVKIGQRLGFSNFDIAKIRLLYRCIGSVAMI